MKLKIYKTFTQENNIIMSQDVLLHLEKHISDTNTLNLVLEKYLELYSTSKADIKKIENIFDLLKSKSEKSLERNYFLIKNNEFVKMNLKNKFNFLKQKIQAEIQPIYSLKENEETIIFGIYYISSTNKQILEDIDNTVELDFKYLNDSICLIENTFISVKGILINEIFQVNQVVLPQILKSKTGDLSLQKNEKKIIFISDFLINKNYLKRLENIILLNSKVNIIVLMGQFKVKNIYEEIKEFTNKFININFIIVPDKNDIFPSFLPKVLPYNLKYKNIYFTTNPTTIFLNDRTIYIIKEDIFRNNKNKSTFLDTNFKSESKSCDTNFKDKTDSLNTDFEDEFMSLETNNKENINLNHEQNIQNKSSFQGTNFNTNFITTYFSQYSFVPSYKEYMSFDNLPDLFIVGQKSFSHCQEIRNVLFASSGEFNKEGGTYILYDALQNKVEIKSLN
ncbi:hypothetical protein CWI38_0236p0030 [Hamiltosporidium tvaerminnensis]|uniref:DNA polymerase alpha subunit B n=1 Tax=Hamiltosporidium tvaerminnensis TaxID=1176355 RepID=A0A4Q9M1R8_9MICR|nr:hypothetical protein CWI38_0236p0030 [Hamiltosporidium tvaerminnensis]